MKIESSKSSSFGLRLSFKVLLVFGLMVLMGLIVLKLPLEGKWHVVPKG
jgi:hypothetical protein